MKSMRRWGYDLFFVSAGIHEVVEASKRYDLRLFDIDIKKDGISFFAAIAQRKRIIHALPYAIHQKTTGILGFLLAQLKKPRRMVGIITSLLVLILALNTVFAIEIRGSSQILDQKIQAYLKEEGIAFPRRKMTQAQFQALEQQLKQHFFEEIEWINLSRIGSSYFIDYVQRIKKSPQPKFMDPLVAHQSGVIARFDVKRGVKAVKEHDVVHVGDILVTPDVTATDNQMYQTYVEGKVYAFTRHDIEVVMKHNIFTKIHESMGFFQLLFESRRKIARQLQEDESIVEENVLQFVQDETLLTLKVHYILLEDITHP